MKVLPTALGSPLPGSPQDELSSASQPTTALAVSSLVSFQEKSSSRLPWGPFSTSHTLSPCPGDKDIQTNPDISLAGLILNLILLLAEKLALPLAATSSPAPLARAAAEPPGCPGCDQANSREQENTLLSCFPSPFCPGTQPPAGHSHPLSPSVPPRCVTCLQRNLHLPAGTSLSSQDTPVLGFPGTKLTQL